MLTDSAAVWIDSLSQDIRDDWDQLKTAFLARYTTPEFLKYKHANDLFNYKQESKSVDDYTTYMQKLALQIGANDEILRFAVINGLRPEIKNHVTTQQPTSWTALVQAARVGEMCTPVTPTQSDPNVAVQIELMRDQLNQLAVEKRVALINGPSRSNSQSQSHSSSERRVRFDDGDGDRFDVRCRRSLSPIARRDDRRGSDECRRFSQHFDNRHFDNRHGNNAARTASPEFDHLAGLRSPDGMRFYSYREAPKQVATGTGSPTGRGRGAPRGRGNYRGNFRGNFRGDFRGRCQPPHFGNQSGAQNESWFKCGRRRHQHLNMCPAINQQCRGCGRKGHFLRVVSNRPVLWQAGSPASQFSGRPVLLLLTTQRK